MATNYTRISCQWQTHVMRCTVALHHGECAANKQDGCSVWQTCDRAKLTTLRVESWHLHLTYPHLHLAPLLGVTPYEFCRDLRHQKTKVPGLLCLHDPLIRYLAVSVEHQLVTDGQRDRQKDTQQQLISALASIAWVKTNRHNNHIIHDNCAKYA